MSEMQLQKQLAHLFDALSISYHQTQTGVLYHSQLTDLNPTLSEMARNDSKNHLQGKIQALLHSVEPRERKKMYFMVK
jgi:hypothetical protein